MNGRASKTIREILNFKNKGEHPYLDKLYKRTKKEYSRLPHNVRGEFLSQLNKTLNPDG